MKNIFALLTLSLMLSACNNSAKNATEPAADQQEEWIQLFNGKDLDDWIIKINHHPLGENFNNTFRIEDGMMVTRYEEYDSFRNEYGHIFYKEPFSHYKLRVEYRIRGEQVTGGEGWAFKNSGVMFHCQHPESMGLDQPFPVSLEAQFLGGTGEGERPTANLCTPGTHVTLNGEFWTEHCVHSSSPTFHGEEWVNFELVVYGDSIIHHLVNGDTVLSYSNPVVGGQSLPEDYPLPEGTAVKSGYIALQAESHPYEFRKVELLNLKPDKSN